MKHIKRSIWIFIVAALLVTLLPMLLIHIPAVQRSIAQITANWLSEKTGAKTSIKSVEIMLFNQLNIKDVYIEDQQGDTLLYAKRLSLGFDPFAIVRRHYRIHSARLSKFTLHLSREDEQSPLNIRFLLDAFQNPNTTKTHIDLNINRLYLYDGSITYRNYAHFPKDNSLNFNDIKITDCYAKLQIKRWTNHVIETSLKQLKFKEQSGFEVKNMTAALKMDNDSLKISGLNLKLPHSDFQMKVVATGNHLLQPPVDWTDSVDWQVSLLPSEIAWKDLIAFYPLQNVLPQSVSVNGKMEGSLNDIKISRLDLFQSDGAWALNTQLHLMNLFEKEDADGFQFQGYIKDSYIQPSEIQKLADMFVKQQTTLPDYLHHLGMLILNGEMSGSTNNWNLSLLSATDVGNAELVIQLIKNQQYQLNIGMLSEDGIRLNELLDNNDLGNLQMAVNIETTFNQLSDIQGNINAVVDKFTFKNYDYENIQVSGNFVSNGFNGRITMDNPAGQLFADAAIRLADARSEYHISMQANDWQLDRLNLLHSAVHPKITFRSQLYLTGNQTDNIDGQCALQHIELETDRGDCVIDSLVIALRQQSETDSLTIQSDILNGELTGVFSTETLLPTLRHSLASYLPSLFNDTDEQPDIQPDVNWHFTLDNTQKISEILALPVVFYDSAVFAGAYNGEQNLIQTYIGCPHFYCAGSNFNEGNIELNNGNSYLELKIKGNKQQKKTADLPVEAAFRAANDSIYSNLTWGAKGDKYQGKLDFTTQISLPENAKRLDAFFAIHPSEMVFNDSIWRMTPTTISYQADKISIHNFQAAHNLQQIDIEGDISENPNDQLFVQLQKVDLDYIFKSLKIEALTFGGIATGEVRAKDVYHTRELSTQLQISNFSFNDAVFGELDLRGRWDNEKQGVEMLGHVVKNDSSWVDIDGYIYPVAEELSILFEAHRSEATFLRKYLNNVVKDISGELTGNIRLFGSLNYPEIEGEAWAKDCSFGIEFLNTRYSFSDSILFKPNEISVRNVTLYDVYGHQALFSGSVFHRYFLDFKFAANLTMTDFLVFNAIQRNSPTFYGRVFGSGATNITGTEESVEIDVNLQNSNDTELTLDFMKKPDVIDYDFITFVNKNFSDEPYIIDNKTNNSSAHTVAKTDIRLNLLVSVNNDAVLNLVMDPLTNDKITASGTGNMQIQYGTQTPLKVIGNYQIENGKYNFSFQQAFFRKFDLAEGSSIDFHGDPLTANLDIKAAYTLSANLGDLDQQLLVANENNHRLSARNNVPVSCVLLLSGPLEQPVIQFDVELPGATSELERQVKSYIRTDDMMSRQMIYLLLMGRFYTAPEYAQTERSTADLSLLTSTLSSQISNLLGNLSNTIQIGTNYHQSYYEGGDSPSTEVELLLSSTLLNNRLIINGNIGYVDNPYLKTINEDMPLIGDFDFEYKLTKSGDIRLKGFNHYNYRNFFSNSPEMTQGFGILFRRDFNRLWDIFIHKK